MPIVPPPLHWPTITPAQAAVWRACRCFTLTSEHDRRQHPHGLPASHFTQRQLTYPGRVTFRV